MTVDRPPEMLYAGFSKRAIAWAIDMVTIVLAFDILLGSAVAIGEFLGLPPLFYPAAPSGNPKMPVIVGNTVILLILLFLICWLYSALLTSSSYGGTLGKQIMGLRVVDFAGNRLTFSHATIRFIAKIFAGMILFIGFLMIRSSEKKQGLHDRFAGTYVVFANRDPPAKR